ncbi:transposase family protein [Sulfurimonas sp.]|uniref:integrase catalytic domain-containing protein n=1 Tax=Sulfurimonas sp. TaxID=2022749 RepID=UPI002B45A06A|nr:transposase family protein [Sulfurimonas sp.]
MNSKEVASLVGVSYKSGIVQRITKKALENSSCTMVIKGLTFGFELVHGKAYLYTEFKAKKKTQKHINKVAISSLDELDSFDITASKHSQEDKVLIIAFYKKYNYSLSAIIKSLYAKSFLAFDDKLIASQQRKISRWLSDFNKNGASSLEDKRGRDNAFRKIDEELLIKSIWGTGSQGVRNNYYGAYDMYCGMVQSQNGLMYDWSEKAKEKIISYNAYVNAYKKVVKSDPQLKGYLTGGIDALLQDYPVGIKDIAYPNQEWQVDATVFDFMCKIPDETKEDGYRVGRVHMTAVKDTFTKQAVANLVETIDSYSQVRVLYKAFQKMGIPENIYTDNGMDYVSNHYQKLLIDIGICQIRAVAGQGRQKGSIERYFGVVQGRWNKIPGYIGGDVSKRKKIEDQYASHLGVKTSKATRIETHKLLTLDELRLVVDNLLDMQYESYKAHQEFIASTNMMSDIYSKLGKYGTRTLNTEGIRYNNMTFQGSSLWEAHLNKGEVVTFYENIDNVNELYIYKQNQYIGVVKNKELGAECMNQEDHKKVTKIYKQTNIKPKLKILDEANEELEKQKVAFISAVSGHKPLYTTQSDMSPKTSKEANNPVTAPISLTSKQDSELIKFIRSVS